MKRAMQIELPPRQKPRLILMMLLCGVAGAANGQNATLTASPNPISSTFVGATTLTWSAPGVSAVQIRVGSNTGPVMAAGGSSGSAQTGNWVTNGMVFYLMNGTSTLATTTVQVQTPALTLTATPNPIISLTSVGATTLMWSAPGVSAVQIRVGSNTGPVMAVGGSSGSAQTGNWVTNGMVFYLMNGASTLATTAVQVQLPQLTFVAAPNPTITSTRDSRTGVLIGSTTLTWVAPGVSGVQIRVGSATGPIMAAGGPSGSAQTGVWVTDGMVFYLMNGASILATRTVQVQIGSLSITSISNSFPLPLTPLTIGTSGLDVSSTANVTYSDNNRFVLTTPAVRVKTSTCSVTPRSGQNGLFARGRAVEDRHF